MSDSNKVPQADLNQLIAQFRNSTPAKSVLAAIVALLALLVPFVTLSTNLGMGFDQSGYLNGFDAAGWAAWLTLIVYALAAASWFVVQLGPYRLILAGATIVVSLLAIIMGIWFNPVTAQLSAASPAGASLVSVVQIGPNVGIFILLLAAAVSGFVAWKSR